jgi:hypothetical protein
MAQAVWALGNIAGEGPSFRELILNSGGLPPILHLLSNCPRVEVIRTATWTLANLCRGKGMLPDFQVRPLTIQLPTRITCNNRIFPCHYTLLKSSPSLQKIKTALPILARLIWAEEDEEIVQCAVTALSYISDGGGERIQALIDAGVCRRLCDLLIKYVDCYSTVAIS